MLSHNLYNTCTNNKHNKTIKLINNNKEIGPIIKINAMINHIIIAFFYSVFIETKVPDKNKSSSRKKN
jgi:hypothetical protein